MAQGGSKISSCTKCGSSHLRLCRDGSTSCFKCDQNGHFMRVWPMNWKGNGNGGNRAESFSVAPTHKIASRGATSGEGAR